MSRLPHRGLISRSLRLTPLPLVIRRRLGDARSHLEWNRDPRPKGPNAARVYGRIGGYTIFVALRSAPYRAGDATRGRLSRRHGSLTLSQDAEA